MDSVTEQDYLKKKIKALLKKYKSNTNTVKQSTLWFIDAAKDKHNKVVEPVPITEKFRAGKIYHFRYLADTQDLPYFDTNPVILSLGRIKYKNSICERGLNLNYLPLDVRQYVLNKIFFVYRNLIVKETKRKQSDNATLQKGIPLNYRAIKNILKSVHAEYAIRNYFITNKTHVYSISYENWEWVAFLEKNKFRTLTGDRVPLEKVRNDYYEYIKNKNK